MSIGKRYLLEKPLPSAPWKQYLDLTLLPAVIDVAGAVEMLVELVAVQTRKRPLITLSLALGFGCGLGLATGRRTTVQSAVSPF
jgi:hypothetical protein